MSIGTENGLSTGWRRDGAKDRPTVRAIDLLSFEGTALRLRAAAAPDRRSAVVQVTCLATLLAGDRPVKDPFGRIDLPEFAAAQVSASAEVPNGHTLMVTGMRTKAQAVARGAAPAEPWRGRRDAAALVLVTASVLAP